MFDRDRLLELCRRLSQEPNATTRQAIIRELIVILQIEQNDIRERVRNAIEHQVFYALLLIALAILALIASCSFASNAISSSVNSMSFCGFFSTAILRHSSSIRWSGIVPLLASYFGSGSNDALTLIWPLETVIVRSHNLKPPFLMETRCWPGAAPIVEGVLPT